MPDVVIHPTAIIEDGVELGPGTRVWDHVHIRRGARIGRGCILGEKTYVASEVRIGNYVKINAKVYICSLVTVEDHVMISAHTVFTNDKFPRAFPPDLSGLATSGVTEETLATLVRRGATIGANATIGPGIVIGEFAMIGMGSVVTRDVQDFTLVYGNPARARGYVCLCGPFLGDEQVLAKQEFASCARCGRQYTLAGGKLVEIRIGQTA